MALLGKSLMQVVSYLSSVPAKDRNNPTSEKTQIIKNFFEGVQASGDACIMHSGNYIDSHVAVIQGWVHERSGNSPHLALRKSIIKQQQLKKKYVITADSNLFLYAVGKENLPHHYLRYSFNGVFPNTGTYCDTIVDSQRWRQISRDLNLSLKDYRSNGDHILLCLQRNEGWSMGSVNIQDWAIATINKIRQYTDRPIVVRPHPGDKQSNIILTPGHPQCRIPLSSNVRISTNKSLLDDLKNCWAASNYNSSPVVGAAIEGIPVFVADKTKSQCAEIANDLENIENPTLYDRQRWVERISMFHWKFAELQDGSCWRHMKQFIL
jgi:hypothetical protein